MGFDDASYNCTEVQRLVSEGDTLNDTLARNRDDCRAAQDLASNQETYWLLAVIASGLSLLGLLRLVVEYIRNPYFRKRPFTYFYVMLLGDFMFVSVFFPYHVNNILSLAQDGFVDVESEANRAWCSTAWLFAVNSLTLEFWGLALISYCPYRMLCMSKNAVKAPPVTKKVFGLVFGGALVTGLVWYSVGMSLDLVGSYRGLYCGSKTWASMTGFLLFAYPSIAFTFQVYFYYNSYKVIKEMGIEESKFTGKGSEGAIAKAARSIMKQGIIMVGAFFLTWGPLTIACFLNMIGVEVPIQFDMLAGICAKFKGFLDTIIILNMRQLNPKSKTSRSVVATETKLSTKVTTDACSTSHTN